ncbi:MAG: hypothetical protein DRH51_05575 [Candidatus Coatesbacteria bacterium]|nr:MAG: hypothetical protein DRH51_05575 [Candidatus Coatesbacteria bacterium]
MATIARLYDFETDSANNVPISSSKVDAEFDQIINLLSGASAFDTVLKGQIVIEDTDADTKIQVEESADEDKIRIDIEGVETAIFGDGANEAILELNNDGTGYGLYLHQDGVLAANKYALFITSTVAQTNAELVKFSLTNSSSNQRLFYISNDGTASSLRIDHNNSSSSAQVFYIYNAGTGNSIEDDSGAHLTAAGVWTDASEGELKTNFKEEKVLDKIRRIAVKKYQYKKFRKDGGKKEWRGEVFPEWHFSPVAEDFHRVFGLGDGKGISAKSLAGIALQGIKELLEKVEKIEQWIKKIEQVKEWKAK